MVVGYAVFFLHQLIYQELVSLTEIHQFRLVPGVPIRKLIHYLIPLEFPRGWHRCWLGFPLCLHSVLLWLDIVLLETGCSVDRWLSLHTVSGSTVESVRLELVTLRVRPQLDSFVMVLFENIHLFLRRSSISI